MPHLSDNDRACRYEQTMLMLTTLKHFNYDADKTSFALMHGKHCEHDTVVDENGDDLL